MDKFAIWSYMEVKPGKEQEVEEFLKYAQSLIEQEPGTTTFYALKIGANTYATFDTFSDEAARNAHANGLVAKALYAKVEELFTQMPMIVQTTILRAKAPGA
ncbi:putative quinol monooxygenase [Nostoc sp.]|uniref:putative quinol monooxygenase n=1 Tax=Nostoc sp. TaxID=1180 RepID=UPI002FF65954